jgi:hypothetical protein
MTSSITCPQCGHQFEAGVALRREIQSEFEHLLKAKDDQIKKFRDLESDLKQQLQKQLETERKNIYDKYLFQIKERELTIDSLKKSLDEAQRKASQGSQQLQGEVQEIELEHLLRQSFPSDIVAEIKKGTMGADIRHTVKTPKGTVCGVILWESKRTKSWSPQWPDKLKSDLRAEKAHLPIIVSSVLPKEASAGIGLVDGVWVASFAMALPLAELLRKNLIDVAYQKFISHHQDDKSSQLYEYITGHEFRQQLEAIIEVYLDMQSQIEKERISFTRIWSVRESQIRQLFSGTSSVIGHLRGLVGPSFSSIKGLELLDSPDP